MPRALVAVLAIASLAAACGGAQPTASVPESAPPSEAPQSVAPATAAPSEAPSIVGLIDIGGRSLALECHGAGQPTIVYLHGYDGRAWHGAHLFTYASRHQVCTYDRANIGDSDPVEGIQTGADIVDDLTRLLAAAEVPGPYLLVAASHGGLIAEVFAGTHPDEVVGIVLVDASLHADGEVDRYFASRGELDLEAFQAEYATGVEATAWTIHDEAAAALATIPDVPIIYLLALLEDRGLPPEAEAVWEHGLADLLARSSNGQRIGVEGPHVLPPEPIHEAVNEVLALLAGS